MFILCLCIHTFFSVLRIFRFSSSLYGETFFSFVIILLCCSSFLYLFLCACGFFMCIRLLFLVVVVVIRCSCFRLSSVFAAHNFGHMMCASKHSANVKLYCIFAIEWTNVVWTAEVFVAIKWKCWCLPTHRDSHTCITFILTHAHTHTVGKIENRSFQNGQSTRKERKNFYFEGPFTTRSHNKSTKKRNQIRQAKRIRKKRGKNNQP